MKFSERKGLKPVSKIIQTDGMNANLRNSLWNALDISFWSSQGFLWNKHARAPIEPFSATLWFEYFKEPIDSRPRYPEGKLNAIRDYFFRCEWNEVYEFLEFVLNYFKDQYANKFVNDILERELAGYRFVGGVITDITDKQEAQMLEETLADTEFPGVRKHLQTALELLSKRDNPDYRNSIKESISAVESLCRVITKNDKATLGDALKVIERSGGLHQALKAAFSSLYGYTSDEQGIRHAMLEEPALTVADAKFFLLSCTSFINYLKSKF
jgi:hypothetical protein